MNRRKLLGSLAVVGGVSAMPSTWVKPVINSVVLPAHAQTSDTGASLPSINAAGPALTLSATSIDATSLFSLLDILTPVIDVTPSTSATASGGQFGLIIEAISSSTALVELRFIDSALSLSPLFTFLLSFGDSFQAQGFVDSEGFVFGLDVSLSLDGNTLNLSLIL